MEIVKTRILMLTFSSGDVHSEGLTGIEGKADRIEHSQQKV